MSYQPLANLDAWIWRYRENTRNYPGLHFTAREPSCGALIECLDWLGAQRPGSRRLVQLRRLDPVDEEKITGGQRFADFDELEIKFSGPSAELRYLFVGRVGRRAFIEVTPASIDLLRRGFDDVRRGVGDYAIAPDPQAGPLGARDVESLCLWFWPCFGHTHPVGGRMGSPWRSQPRRGSA